MRNGRDWPHTSASTTGPACTRESPRNAIIQEGDALLNESTPLQNGNPLRATVPTDGGERTISSASPSYSTGT